MTLARTTSVAVLGVEGQLVEIQADLADGLPGVTMIGLPDAALQEARAEAGLDDGGRPVVQQRRVEKAVGRNEPCPCGSGKKYKNCHLRADEEAQASGVES